MPSKFGDWNPCLEVHNVDKYPAVLKLNHASRNQIAFFQFRQGFPSFGFPDCPYAGFPTPVILVEQYKFRSLALA